MYVYLGILVLPRGIELRHTAGILEQGDGLLRNQRVAENSRDILFGLIWPQR